MQMPHCLADRETDQGLQHLGTEWNATSVWRRRLAVEVARSLETLTKTVAVKPMFLPVGMMKWGF